MPALLLLFAAAAVAAEPPAALPPKVVSPVVVTSQPKRSPPVDAPLIVSGDEDSPTNQQVSIWPAGAYQVRASGQVTLACFINAEGFAERCRVAYEEPLGRGFGKAALAMRPHIKVAPRKGPDGQPVAGEMNVGLTFRAPDTDIQTAMDTNTTGHAAWVEVTHNPLPIKKITLMNNPVWAAAPDFDAVASAYPEKAGGVSGYAVAHCTVAMSGELGNCKVATEDPARAGFGPAAVKLASRFRVRPEVMARAPKGEPIAVDVPIRFAPPGAARVVEAPTWIAGFDPDAAVKLFPPEAAAKGLTTGRGVARCRVRPDGGMADCAPDSADPDGVGFAQAAARLAATMKMNLWSADAGPVEGGTVRVAFRLNLKPAS